MTLDNLLTPSITPKEVKAPQQSDKALDTPLFDPYTLYNGVMRKPQSQGSGKVDGKLGDRAKDAYHYFTNKGVPKHIAQGLVGNLAQESGIRPLGYDDGANGPGGGGVAQWSPIRFNGLKKYASQSGKDPNEVHTQYDYILNELDTTENKAKKAIWSTGDVASATKSIQDTYFRPNKAMANTARRVSVAQSIPQLKYGGKMGYYEEGGEPKEGGLNTSNIYGLAAPILSGVGQVLDATSTASGYRPPRTKRAVLGSTLSGAGQGAATGSVAGPWGTAIGAVVGAGVGFFSGKSKANKAMKDFNQTTNAAQRNFDNELKFRSASVYGQLNPYAYKYGGYPFTPQFEVEKGEVMRGEFALTHGKNTVDNIYEVGGYTHDQQNPDTGGTGVYGAGKGQVFSNSILLYKKDTPATLAKRLTRKLAVTEKNTDPTDVIGVKTLQANAKQVHKQLDQIFDAQEAIKQAYGIGQLKLGGEVGMNVAPVPKIYGINTWTPSTKPIPPKPQGTLGDLKPKAFVRTTPIATPTPQPKQEIAPDVRRPAVEEERVDTTPAKKVAPTIVAQTKVNVAATPPLTVAKPVSKPSSTPPVQNVPSVGLFEKLSYVPAYLSRLKDIYLDSGSAVSKTVIPSKPSVKAVAPTTARPTNKPAVPFIKPDEGSLLDKPVISGDTVSTNSRRGELTMSQVIDLNKVKGGVRNRGEAFSARNMFGSTFYPFSTPDKLNPSDNYIKIQKDGTFAVGKPDGNTVKGSWTTPVPVREITNQFTAEQGYYDFPVTKGGDGVSESINVSKKHGSADINDKTGGGAVIFSTKDNKHQYLVRGSVNQIKDTFNKIKSHHGADELNMFKLDNGSYSSGLFKKNGLSPKDMKEWDNRNVYGGHALVQFAYGGLIDEEDQTRPFGTVMPADATRVKRPYRMPLATDGRMTIEERRARRRADEKAKAAAEAQQTQPIVPAKPQVAGRTGAVKPPFVPPTNSLVPRTQFTGINPLKQTSQVAVGAGIKSLPTVGAPPQGRNVPLRKNWLNDQLGKVNADDAASTIGIVGNYAVAQAANKRMETSYPVNLTNPLYYGYTDQSRSARGQIQAQANQVLNNPNASIGQKQGVFAKSAEAISGLNAQENQNRAQYDSSYNQQNFQINAQNNSILNQRSYQSTLARNQQRSASAENFAAMTQNMDALRRERNQRKLDERSLDIIGNSYALQYGEGFVNDRRR